MSHPPHVTFGWSSAFIPFCAYKTDLNISGTSQDFLKNTNFPLCSSFLPTILEGQLCFKLLLNKTSGQGKGHELMLLLDNNEDRSLQTSFNNKDDFPSSDQTLSFVKGIESIQVVSAKIHINTISPFVGFGEGIYKMTNVKRMTPTEDFLKMPEKDRKCEVEFYENCRTRKLLEECNCAPWELPYYLVGMSQ